MVLAFLTCINLWFLLLVNNHFSFYSYASTDLLSQYNLIYGSEIGAWKTDGKPAVDTTTAIPSEVTAAKMPIIRYAVYDCFNDETCGRDNHTGSLSRTTFDSAISGIVNNLHAVPWIKLLPIARGQIGSVNDETIFCPPTNNYGMNLTMEKDLMNEIHKVYTGPIVIESSNEAEYDCASYWGFGSAGAAGVSKNIGDMYNATMPALVKYARDTLGFSQVVTVGYLGLSGGTNWGQTCNTNAGSDFGYNCTYQTRWIDEFNNEIEANYATHSADTDYIPNVESIHSYCHSSDFASNPFTFDDNICFAFYRNWIKQSRSQLDSIWGSTIGDNIRFSISEWEPGMCADLTTNCWSGWSDPSQVESYYTGWFNMLQGDGVTTGSGTRYWNANVFELASNDETSPEAYFNIIHEDGTPQAWYNTFKSISLADTLANPPTPTAIPATSSQVTASSGSTTSSSDPNFPPGYFSLIMAGPHLQGANAGKFIHGDSGAETFIPNDSLHDDATIAINRALPQDLSQASPVIPYPWMQGINTAGDIFNFQITAAFNGMKIQKFDNPVIIVLPYDQLRLYRTSPNRLKIAAYDPIAKHWSLLSSPVIVDTQRHTVATTVKSFSYFAVGYVR